MRRLSLAVIAAAVTTLPAWGHHSHGNYTMTEYVNQMNERYQTALETQRRAMENPQEYFPAPYGPEVPFMSHPIDAQLELIEQGVDGIRRSVFGDS